MRSSPVLTERCRSHRAYLGKSTLPWLETDFICPLNLLFIRPQKSTISVPGLRRFLVGQGHNKSFHGERNIDKRLLGDEYFVLDILEETEAFLPQKPGLEAVIDAIESVIGRDARHLLTSAGREARSFEAKALAVWATIEFSSATLTELGRYCNRDQSTMSCAARRIEELQALKPDIKEKIEQLRAALTAPKEHASRQGSYNGTLNHPPC